MHYGGKPTAGTVSSVQDAEHLPFWLDIAGGSKQVMVMGHPHTILILVGEHPLCRDISVISACSQAWLYATLEITDQIS